MLFRSGVGWGKEDLFRAFADVQWLRFLGGARRLNLFLKHSGLEPYRVNLRFTQPGFIGPNTSLGLNPFIRKQTEPAFTVDRRGGDIYLHRQIGKIYNAGIGYTYEVVHLDTTTVGDADIQPDLNSLYNKSSITTGFSQTSTDDLFSPTKGFNNGITIKYSGVGPSTYTYLKWLVDVRHYLQIPRAVLATRIKVGQINSYDASGFIPVEDRFYAGGANSVRGWARHELGPEDENGKPLGGNYLTEGSLEFRIPVVGSFNGAIFWDFGNVWEGEFSGLLDKQRHALGAGIRFHTPIGPVRFDIARPVLDQDSHIRWHLTLGQAF